MPRLSAALPEGATVSIVAREGVARGGCVIRSSEGSVDARIETQFRRVREGLLGGDAAGGAQGVSQDGSQTSEAPRATDGGVAP
jgi:flagellar biosynthesis/type III secretory pathway protein FliH